MTTAEHDLRGLSTAELVRSLSNQASLLVHQEIELAKTELKEKGTRAGIAVALLTAAGVAVLLGLGALTAFLILALDGAMPAWTAALCVTALWCAVAAVLAVYGRGKLREAGPPIPEKTVDTLKEDLEWLRHPTS